jgi:hypothetical protein
MLSGSVNKTDSKVALTRYLLAHFSQIKILSSLSSIGALVGFCPQGQFISTVCV